MRSAPRTRGGGGTPTRLLCVPLLALLALPAPSLAADAPEHGVFEPAPVPEAPVIRWSRWLQIGVQADLALQPDPVMKQVYGRQSPFGLRLQVTALFEERFGIGLSAGLQRRQGTGVAPDGDLPKVVLWQVPVAVEGWLRMALWRDQPVVPYLRAGFDVVGAVERVLPAEADDADAVEADDTADEATANTPPDLVPPWHGVKVGVHGGGGVQIRLPFPEITWDGGMTGPPGLRDIYFHLEGWGRSADSFGAPGVDLSAVGVSAGVTLLL